MTSPVGLLELCKCIKDIVCVDERAKKPRVMELTNLPVKGVPRPFEHYHDQANAFATQE